MGQRAKTLGLAAYRGALLTGVGLIIWFQQQFVTRENFDQYKKHQGEVATQVSDHIRWRLDRIERKLDNL